MTVSSLAVVPRGSGACNSDEIAPAVIVVAKISGVVAQKMRLCSIDLLWRNRAMWSISFSAN
jgi:hypothetical protein